MYDSAFPTNEITLSPAIYIKKQFGFLPKNLDLEQLVHRQLAQLSPGAGQTELGQGKLRILNLQQ